MFKALRHIQSKFGSAIYGDTAMIAADFCDEQDGIDYEILSAWLRSKDKLPDGSGSGGGYVDGSGGGYVDGSGRGRGRGSGSGSGSGSGGGNGSGYGGGRGRGSGSGGGNGGGYVDGGGRGRGSGRGNGSGDVKSQVLSIGDSAMPKSGDYVCVRSNDQGVVWGTLVWRSGRECQLQDARQQYSWSNGGLTLFDVVNKDPSATGLRLSRTVPEIDMTEICGVILVPEHLVEAFKNHPADPVNS